MGPETDGPPDHLEPSGVMRRMDRTISATSAALDQASHFKAMAERYKELWLCEVNRGDHDFEEHYGIRELDRARETIAGWSTHQSGDGSITARYES